MSEEQKGPLPVVKFLKIPSMGDPYLEGHRCLSCGAICLGELAAFSVGTPIQTLPSTPSLSVLVLFDVIHIDMHSIGRCVAVHLLQMHKTQNSFTHAMPCRARD